MRHSFLHQSAGVWLAALLTAGAASRPAWSQPGPSGPPVVGLVEAVRRPVKESFEFMGRVQATDRVDLVARVNAFLDERFFTEGAEVKKGDLLYRLEQPPYQADLAAKQAAVAQAEAQLENTGIQLRRAQELLKSFAGTEARRDDALTAQRSTAAQLRSAQAAERQSQINLGYTEIRAPIAGRIGRTAVTVGNVVGPSSGTLATIVSQDPMYVTFPVPMRTALDLRTRYAANGGFEAVAIRLRLPDGRIYGQTGTLNFADVSVGQDTDSLTLRGSIANPVLPASQLGGTRLRELADGEFVTVVLEAAKPVEQLTLPREAVLSDQRGDFVYVVGAEDKVERRTVQLGQSTAETAVISRGLKEGERVVLEGVQRVQPGMRVAPAPADTSTRAADASPTDRS
jgi:membrane fusion protein, multidrug efflux system